MKILLAVGIVGFIGVLGLGIVLTCKAIKDFTDLY
jgi:hypothetical protein